MSSTLPWHQPALSSTIYYILYQRFAFCFLHFMFCRCVVCAWALMWNHMWVRVIFTLHKHSIFRKIYLYLGVVGWKYAISNGHHASEQFHYDAEDDDCALAPLKPRAQNLMVFTRENCNEMCLRYAFAYSFYVCVSSEQIVLDSNINMSAINRYIMEIVLLDTKVLEFWMTVEWILLFRGPVCDFLVLRRNRIQPQ